MVWGIPTLMGILGIGIYLTIRSGFAQVRLLPKAIRVFYKSFQSDGEKDKGSSFRALCTALAATVGTGNIAGVAGAIAIGGPGSIFWMWICALLGMVIKFAEAALAVRYCKTDSEGNVRSGPMYMIELGMNGRWHWLGVCYSFFGIVAALGMGTATQINAVVLSVGSAWTYLGGQGSIGMDLVIAAGISFLIAVCMWGGSRRIGDIASFLVPVASCAYIALGVGALIVHARGLPQALKNIVQGAFSPGAVTGGAVGSVFLALRVGTSRGTFTNEAGMGTAAIAHGESKVDHPARQGLMGIMEVFLDTIVICTVTALVILTSGTDVNYGMDEGAVLTTRAFAGTYGQWVSVPIAIFLCCFAFATMLGWGLYGIRCFGYLFGDRACKWFVLLQLVICVVSVLVKTGTVWMLAEIVNGLMAIPNLICLGALSSDVLQVLRSYEKEERLSAPQKSVIYDKIFQIH